MNVTEMLGIDYPIFQGAMAQISREPLVSAVSNAGGLGILAAGGRTPAEIEAEIKLIQANTNKPFAVNIMLMDQNSEAISELVIKYKVPIVTTGAGSPKKFIEKWKAAGIIVIPVIPNVKIAKKMEALGADAVVAEGMEAGGHIGSLSSLPLWPQVVDAVSIPVIAAGGIGDGRGVLAAFALGASGIQVGTRFLLAKECPVREKFKQLVLEATDTSTLITGSSHGAPVRTIANPLSRKYAELEKQNATDEELNSISQGALKRAVFEDDVINGSVMAGEISGMLNKEESVSDMIKEMFNEAERLKKKLTAIDFTFTGTPHHE